MHTRTITAMFDDYDDAAEAVQRLKAAGIPEADISLLGGNQSMRSTAENPSGTRAEDADDTASDAGKGAAVGGVLGGGVALLAGLGLLAIPGLGPVVAAGWLTTALLGTTAGALVGGLIGALTHAGIPEEDAHAYAEGIRRGSTLVTVRAADHLVDKAVDILDDEGTVNMDERVASWRKEGWSGQYSESQTIPSGSKRSQTVPSMGGSRSTGQPQSGSRVRVHTPMEYKTEVEMEDRRVRGTSSPAPKKTV